MKVREELCFGTSIDTMFRKELGYTKLKKIKNNSILRGYEILRSKFPFLIFNTHLLEIPELSLFLKFKGTVFLDDVNCVLLHSPDLSFISPYEFWYLQISLSFRGENYWIRYY